MGGGIMTGMRSELLTFATIARTVARQARTMGLVVPVFRSPPRLAGADRTICLRHGDLIVAVRSRGRPFGDVASDVVEGIVVCNPRNDRETMHIRRELLRALEAELPVPSQYRGVEARVA